MNAISPLPIDRRAERTHLFLVATLSFGRASVAVRVRNLSATGALIEAASLPPTGSAITLSRGGIEVVGTIVWAGGGKAGLTFSGSVDVTAWLPTKDAKKSLRIDPIAAEVQKASTAPAAPIVVADGAWPIDAIVAELDSLRAQLDQLGDQLARDADMVARHPDVHLIEAAGPRIATIIEALKRGA